jgi:hypothetical protein
MTGSMDIVFSGFSPVSKMLGIPSVRFVENATFSRSLVLEEAEDSSVHIQEEAKPQ